LEDLLDLQAMKMQRLKSANDSLIIMFLVVCVMMFLIIIV